MVERARRQASQVPAAHDDVAGMACGEGFRARGEAVVEADGVFVADRRTPLSREGISPSVGQTTLKQISGLI